MLCLFLHARHNRVGEDPARRTLEAVGPEVVGCFRELLPELQVVAGDVHVSDFRRWLTFIDEPADGPHRSYLIL